MLVKELEKRETTVAAHPVTLSKKPRKKEPRVVRRSTATA